MNVENQPIDLGLLFGHFWGSAHFCLLVSDFERKLNK